MAKTKDMPISVTERKKAEELIKAKFRNLAQVVDNEVKDKRTELQEVWSRRIGLDKLKQKLAAKQAEVEALEEQIKEVSDTGYYGDNYENAVPKPKGALRTALSRLESAHRDAKAKLDEKQSETLERLWFGLLAEDALNLLSGIPTLTQLKSNGMSLLTMPATKLLGKTRG
jgi:hypothetical protein